jgi:hypothetical protein
MKGTRPSPPPASSIDSCAEDLLDSETWASSPSPGLTMFAASRPRVSATIVAARK